MIYLSNDDLESINVIWTETIDVIEKALMAYDAGDFEQPIKPYIHPAGDRSRIIAMPAFLGEGFQVAGLKWISSYPGNLDAGLPRSYSTTILNNADNGKPLCIVDSPILSSIRTASVSGLLLRRAIPIDVEMPLIIGMIGGGHIGEMHAKMICDVYGDKVKEIRVYDVDKEKVLDWNLNISITRCTSWSEAISGANVIVTATTSSQSYINEPIDKGVIVLNVSLRDFCIESINSVDEIVVDSWEEVCRKGTDIEMMHKHGGLKKSDVWTLSDLVNQKSKFDFHHKSLIFNPMGLAVFDMAITDFFYHKALRLDLGVKL